MHKFKSNINGVPSISQGSSRDYLSREVTNPKIEMARRILDDMPNYDLGHYNKQIINDFVDDFVDVPSIPPEHLDQILEKVSQYSRVNLITVEAGYQLIKRAVINGPFMPKDAHDAIKPNPISMLAESYFRNVADSALFRENTDYSRYESNTYNSNISTHPMLQDFGPDYRELYNDDGNNENDLTRFLGKSPYVFDETDLGIDDIGENEKTTVSNNYEDLNDYEYERDRDHYRDEMHEPDFGDYDFDPDLDFGL
ncbi:hypothetical protein [uncultured Lacinutrix sp.]|uniref:hypothetical protein n=1 Tax=uncultured Lacinutrix sp. TaxID=574032 RepID=UPI0026090FC3|nr:hypothetical protein [uncultured Lacinutrix sp.]